MSSKSRQMKTAKNNKFFVVSKIILRAKTRN